MVEIKEYNIIAIMGKAGAGKDTFMNELVKIMPNTKPIISCTTRPIREGEQDGVNYHYLTHDQFAEQVLNGKMLEATVFNDWCYGTSLNNLSLDCLNIGVFNPEGVEILRANSHINLTVVYIKASDKVRLLRQLNREEHPDCHEIARRFMADEKDFEETRIKNIIAPDCIITNDGQFSISALAEAFYQQWREGNID